jgi:hypothetical protein
MTAPAIAGHKPNHNPGGGGGGGDATYMITLTNDDVGFVVAAGNGVEGAGASIQGITETGSFERIELGLIETMVATSDVAADYNSICGAVVNQVGPLETIENIEVSFSPEIDTLTAVIGYKVGTQNFVLLLQGYLSRQEEFPPSISEMYDLTDWNNRGGGKGKKNRCGSGFEDLDGVTLDIQPTSP